MIWLIFGLVILISVYSIRKFWLEKRKMDQEAAKKVALKDFSEAPMLERDYMMRYIQAFAKALAEVLLRRKDKQIDEALRVISDAFAEDREANGLVDLPLDEFLAQVDYKEDFNAQKWALAAELLYERAEMLAIQNQPEASKEYFIKAMHLSLEVLLSDPETYRQTTIDLVRDLKRVLRPEELPESTLASLVEYEGGRN